LAAGIAQEQLAHQADLERSYLGRIERGQSQPTLFVVLKIAAALGLQGGELVSEMERGLRRMRRASR
jgi:transcriptional regulator with XRE-family HTH domain